jgi:hypothetical protein
LYGLKHQKEKRSMDHFAGLDVSVKESSVCIVDETGKIVREVKVASEPEALLSVLKNPAYRFKRIGLEAGPLSQWLFGALAEAELPVVCVETRHMQAALKAQINKTDRNDARGIAQMMRVGLYRPVHVKTLRSQKLRMLLTHRKLLQSKAIAIENDLRGTLRNFGLKVGMVGTAKFEARIKELIENLPDLAVLIEPLLVVRRALREQFDGPRCRPCGGTDLSRHRRRTGSLPQIQGRRCRPTLEAYGPQRSKAVRDADAEADVVANPTPLRCQRSDGVSHFEGHADGLEGGVIHRHRIVEDHHHAIASVAFERPAVLDDYFADSGMVVAQQRHHVFRVRTLGEARKAPQVAEQRGNLPAVAL